MHIENFPRADYKQILGHDARQHNQYKNSDINPNYKSENYNLAPNHGSISDAQFLENQLQNYEVCKQKKTAVLSSVIIDMPREIPFEDREKFFRAAYEFLEGFYGKENVVSAWVHYDEYKRAEDGITPLPPEKKGGMPHMHFCAIPEVDGHVAARRKLQQKDMKAFHINAQKAISAKMGYEVPILNGSTAGGKHTVEEYKAERLEEQNQILTEELAEKNRIIEEKDKTIEEKDKTIEIKDKEIKAYRAEQKVRSNPKEVETAKTITGKITISEENLETLKNAAIKGAAVKAVKESDLAKEADKMASENINMKYENEKLKKKYEEVTRENGELKIKLETSQAREAYYELPKEVIHLEYYANEVLNAGQSEGVSDLYPECQELYYNLHNLALSVPLAQDRCGYWIPDIPVSEAVSTQDNLIEQASLATKESVQALNKSYKKVPSELKEHFSGAFDRVRRAFDDLSSFLGIILNIMPEKTVNRAKNNVSIDD